MCDLLDLKKVQAVAEHAGQITSFLLKEEKNFLLENYYLPKKSEDNERVIEPNRAILVDYLADLHFKFKLRQETLYVTVGIID